MRKYQKTIAKFLAFMMLFSVFFSTPEMLQAAVRTVINWGNVNVSQFNVSDDIYLQRIFNSQNGFHTGIATDPVSWSNYFVSSTDLVNWEIEARFSSIAEANGHFLAIEVDQGLNPVSLLYTNLEDAWRQAPIPDGIRPISITTQSGVFRLFYTRDGVTGVMFSRDGTVWYDHFEDMPIQDQITHTVILPDNTVVAFVPGGNSLTTLSAPTFVDNPDWAWQNVSGMTREAHAVSNFTAFFFNGSQVAVRLYIQETASSNWSDSYVTLVSPDMVNWFETDWMGEEITRSEWVQDADTGEWDYIRETRPTIRPVPDFNWDLPHVPDLHPHNYFWSIRFGGDGNVANNRNLPANTYHLFEVQERMVSGANQIVGMITVNQGDTPQQTHIFLSGVRVSRYTQTSSSETSKQTNNNVTSGTAPNISTASSWAHSRINQAFSLDLIPQSLQGNYSANITRAEFAALAVTLYEKVTGTTITGRMSFNDTNDINVQKMGYLGVVTGVGEGNFAPNRGLTRQEAAVMLARLATALGQTLPTSAPTFADNAALSSWAVGPVGQMQAIGIMGETSNNNFSPLSPYTREQSIVTISRLFDLFS